MRTSKYLNKIFGDWQCTHVGVARVQSVFTHKRGSDGRKIKSKRPGHRTYYYIFERLTSDSKAMKMIRLNAAQVKQVLDGKYDVEYFADKKAAKRSQVFKEKVSYSFCD